MDTFGGIPQQVPCLRRPLMSVRRRTSTDSRVVQPALALGHAEVRWDALPPAVQVDVLARWCEMLSDIITAGATTRTDAESRETR